MDLQGKNAPVSGGYARSKSHRQDSKIFVLPQDGFRNSSKVITLVSEIAGEKLGFEFSEDNDATNENPALDSQEENDINEV